MRDCDRRRAGLAVLYNGLGWKGRSNVRQIHLADQRWLEKYHSGRCREASDTGPP